MIRAKCYVRLAIISSAALRGDILRFIRNPVKLNDMLKISLKFDRLPANDFLSIYVIR